MPTNESAVTVTVLDATGALPAATYSEIIILSETGHKVETPTPYGIDAQPDGTQMTNGTVVIQGISNFTGLTVGAKNLVFVDSGTTLSWDAGTAVDITANGNFTLYDSGGSNYILINVTDASLMTGDETDVITVQAGVLVDQIVLIDALDDIDADSFVIKDAAGNTCTSAGTYPRPTAAGNYAVDATDASLIAIKSAVSPATVIPLSLDYVVYNTVRQYGNLAALVVDHNADSDAYEAGAKIFAAGVNHVRVINVSNNYDGSTPAYATAMTTLLNEGTDYDIMVPCIAVGTVSVADADYVLMAAHALVYRKVLCSPIANVTASAARTAFGLVIADDTQQGISYNDSSFTAAELAGGLAATIALQSPWVSNEHKGMPGFTASGYSPDDITLLEGTASSIRIGSIISFGGVVSFSTGKALKAGSWLDAFRTEQYVTDLLTDDMIVAMQRRAQANQKFEYSPKGIGEKKAILEASCMKAQRAGALRLDDADTGTIGYLVTMPVWGDISDANKANRHLPDVYVTIYPSSQISTVAITLTISV